jgi:hypothetical protein
MRAPPNLFDFATSELSQDAFICWLASWANPALKGTALHATATLFLDTLLEVAREPKVSQYTCIKALKQQKGIDVLLLVNDDIAIIVEDKTNTRDHSDQLNRYRTAVTKMFPSRHTVAAVYFKTGDQCDYRSAEDAGYGCFLRGDFLKILRRGEALGVTNAIFTDFHRYLQGIEEAVTKFATFPLQEWKRNQWQGFFEALRKALGDGAWLDVGHGGGSTPTFRWHRRDDDKFLRLARGELAFKVEEVDETQQESKWREWNRALMERNGAHGIKIITPRRQFGKRMTVAVLDGDYRQTNDGGLLDFDGTVNVLQSAEKVMDAALGTV